MVLNNTTTISFEKTREIKYLYFTNTWTFKKMENKKVKKKNLWNWFISFDIFFSWPEIFFDKISGSYLTHISYFRISGALGPVDGVNPELSNLTCSMTYVEPGDIVFLTSDGISDNFDPVVGKFCVPRRTDRPGKIRNFFFHLFKKIF